MDVWDAKFVRCVRVVRERLVPLTILPPSVVDLPPPLLLGRRRYNRELVRDPREPMDIFADDTDC